MAEEDFHLDKWLDNEVRDVWLPRGLMRRLRSIPLADDAEVDAALNDVPLPPDLLTRLGRIARVPPLRTRLANGALAASLFLALTAALWGVVGLQLADFRPNVATNGGLAQAVTVASPSALAEDHLELALGPLPANTTDAPSPSELAPPPVHLADPGDALALAPTAPIADLVPGDFAIEYSGYRGDVRAAGPDRPSLPDVRRAPGLAIRGASFPLVPWASHLFLRRTGVHPFVTPALHTELTQCVVPLGVAPHSWEIAQEHLGAGEFPPPDSMRLEEILAGVDLGYPAPEGGPVQLFAAGGPAPWNRPTHLLQVAAVTAPAEVPARDPRLLVLAVDVSADMGRPIPWAMTRRALADLGSAFVPGDRVALVTFHETAELVLDAVEPDADSWRAAVESLRTGGVPHLGEGLRAAYAVAERALADEEGAEGAARPGRVVLISGGMVDLEPAAVTAAEKFLADAADRGIALTTIDVCPEARTNPTLRDLASAGGGRSHRVPGGGRLAWTLREWLSDHSLLVAGGAQLVVQFNPEVVFAYRLLGHEAGGLAGLVSEEYGADLSAGQSQTGLFEVFLHAGEARDNVADIRLNWHDPASGKQREAARRIERGDFALSPDAAPASWQKAAVAAVTAELLRDSPFAGARPNSASFGRVANMAQEIDADIAARTSLSELVAFLELAASARPYRGGGHR